MAEGCRRGTVAWAPTLARARGQLHNHPGPAIVAGMEQPSSTTERVRSYVHALAGTIGERNVFRPRALQAAADFIESEWRAQGYPVESQASRRRACAAPTSKRPRPARSGRTGFC